MFAKITCMAFLNSKSLRDLLGNMTRNPIRTPYFHEADFGFPTSSPGPAMHDSSVCNCCRPCLPLVSLSLDSPLLSPLSPSLLSSALSLSLASNTGHVLGCWWPLLIMAPYSASLNPSAIAKPWSDPSRTYWWPKHRLWEKASQRLSASIIGLSALAKHYTHTFTHTDTPTHRNPYTHKHTHAYKHTDTKWTDEPRKKRQAYAYTHIMLICPFQLGDSSVFS